MFTEVTLLLAALQRNLCGVRVQAALPAELYLLSNRPHVHLVYVQKLGVERSGYYPGRHKPQVSFTTVLSQNIGKFFIVIESVVLEIVWWDSNILCSKTIFSGPSYDIDLKAFTQLVGMATKLAVGKLFYPIAVLGQFVGAPEELLRPVTHPKVSWALVGCFLSMWYRRQGSRVNERPVLVKGYPVPIVE
jgi:hypothetical protein